MEQELNLAWGEREKSLVSAWNIVEQIRELDAAGSRVLAGVNLYLCQQILDSLASASADMRAVHLSSILATVHVAAWRAGYYKRDALAR